MEQCPYCKKYLLASQIEQHVCNAPLLDVKEIPVLFSCQTTNDNGEKVIIARGYDGVLYRLVKCRNPILDSSDDGYHEGSNRRKVNRTCFSVLVTS